MVHDDPAARSTREQRIYGLNACLALFAKRPEAIRKVWLLENRIPRLKAVLAWCVQHRLGYTLVQADDLEKLSGSAHHEGVCFGVLPAGEGNLSDWLQNLPPGPAVALWLDGVGNPHNLGAILRSAAHFGAAAVLLPRESELALSGAAARVAEGGAEVVPIVRLGRADNAFAQLSSSGFGIAATVVRGGTLLHAATLPQRVVWVLGAEQLGVDAELAKRAAVRIQIPGTGLVDSLNVASAAAVLLSEWWRQQGPRKG
ncbi:MAG: TrmH family RNA methyltransferase [Arenimonas sp.]